MYIYIYIYIWPQLLALARHAPLRGVQAHDPGFQLPGVFPQVALLAVQATESDAFGALAIEDLDEHALLQGLKTTARTGASLTMSNGSLE